VVGSCEYGNEPLHSTKGRELLDKQNDYLLLKKNYSIELVGWLELNRYGFKTCSRIWLVWDPHLISYLANLRGMT
jgi:hypothetical protein